MSSPSPKPDFLSPDFFVGRKPELARWLEVLGDPRGQAVLVVGPPAMGKTVLINRMAQLAIEHPNYRCGHIRQEITPSDSVSMILELMIEHAFEAAKLAPGSFSGTPQRVRQWRAFFKAWELDKITELIASLRSNQKRHIRDRFLDLMGYISKKMPSNGRALFLIDPEKLMQTGSDADWALITKNLPDKIKLFFAQRPEDALANNPEFRCFTADNRAVRIPQDSLDILDNQAVEELISDASSRTSISSGDLRQALTRYNNHPYAVRAAIGLLADGISLTDLPSDPTPERIAEVQWKRACRGGDSSSRGEEAIRLFEAYAVSQVPVPDDVAQAVSGLTSSQIKSLFADTYLSHLLRAEPSGKRIYHVLLADHILSQLGQTESLDLHRRAIACYHTRLQHLHDSQQAPDELSLLRLPEHVLAAEGPSAFIQCFLDYTPAMCTIGLLDGAISLSHRALIYAQPDSPSQAALWGNLGLIHRTRGNLEYAEEFHRKALALHEKLGYLGDVANDCNNLGLIYSIRGDLNRAVEFHQRALIIHEDLGQLEHMAGDNANLGVIYRTRGESNRAEEFHRKALLIHKTLNHLRGIANDYGNLGLICWDRGEMDHAAEFHQKALVIHKKLGHLVGMANDYGNLGMIYSVRGDLGNAEESQREALSINEKLGCLEGIANAYGNLGTIYENRGDLDHAEDFLRKALAIDESLGRLEGMANGYGNLGVLYRMRGDLHHAEESHCRALSINERLGRLEGMANEHCNISVIHLMRGELDHAGECQRKALAIHERLGNLMGMANDYGNLGVMYKNRGDLDNAEKSFREALTIHEKLGHLEGMATAYANLGGVAELRHSFDQARDLWTQSRDLFQRIGMPHMVQQIHSWIAGLPPEPQ